MARPVTLFTGQWADLPLTELAKKASGWGYDGLELACWAIILTRSKERQTRLTVSNKKTFSKKTI